MITIQKTSVILQTMLVTFFLFSLTGCQPPHHKPRSAKEALSDYASCLERIPHNKSLSSSELIAAVRDWQSADSAAYSVLCTHIDTTSLAVAADSVYCATRDSILSRLCNLVDSRKRTFRDYIEVARSCTRLQLNATESEFLAFVQDFFTAMDSMPPFDMDRQAAVKYYEVLLEEAAANGFRSRQEVFSFLRQEERAFRSFLVHLHSLGDVSLEKVRNLTDSVMKRLVQSPDGSGLFSRTETTILLTLRSNRRLVQNARQCVGDIDKGKVKSGNQATAYQWMLLQPWITIDQVSICLMDDPQLSEFQRLADDTPRCFSRLGKSRFALEMNELPSILIKNAIANL